MKIDINNLELYDLLKSKFGEASFRLFFNENEKGREIRTGKKLYESGIAPTTRSKVMNIGEDVCIIDD